MVKAQSLSSAERARLTALVQDKQESDDDDFGTPQASPSAPRRIWSILRLFASCAIWPKKQHSTALSQLASRMVSVVRFATGDKADVFAKIKGLITDMISKLESEAEKDATQ